MFGWAVHRAARWRWPIVAVTKDYAATEEASGRHQNPGSTRPAFELWSKRGKGSERIIHHPDVNGRSAIYPLTFHKGQDVGKGMLKAIIRRFNLPNDIFD